MKRRKAEDQDPAWELPRRRGPIARAMSASAIAPETRRAAVNVAGSIAPGRRATRQRIEFAANATSASAVSNAVKGGRASASSRRRIPQDASGVVA